MKKDIVSKEAAPTHLITKRENKRRRVVAAFDEEDGMTQQHFKDDCDINKIVGKYLRGEDMSSYMRHAQYIDDASITSLTLVEAENIVAKSREAFAALPAQDRDFFANDPVNFVRYMEDPEHLEDSYTRGYRIKPKGSTLTAGEQSSSNNVGTAAPPSGSAENKPDKK